MAAYKGHRLPGVEDDYRGHDPTDPLGDSYHGGAGYNAGKDEFDPTKGYNEQDEKYQDDPFAKDYINNKEEEENKKEEESEGIEKGLEDPKEKYKDEPLDDEKIKKKAADEIHSEVSQRTTEGRKKKSKFSIEDAIEKAIKKEKEVMFLDR